MKKSEIIDLFSPTYSEARGKFLAATSLKGLAVDSYELDLKGAAGEDLATDVVLDGPQDASRMLLVISGVHGVEGFSGSGVQTGLLLSSLPKPPDTAILYVHAINPHGFSHLRRVTQENVDLNRNFINFDGELPRNEAYEQIHEALFPREWPPRNDEALEKYRLAHGDRGLQYAITLGQYRFADGMFFGGAAPTWGNHTMRTILWKYASNIEALASIDIHTGLGPYGLGERIFASFDNGVFDLARKWWGEISNVNTGSSTSVPMTGPIQCALTEECRQAKHVGICLEYGTYPLDQMLNALRADHWAYRYGKKNTVQGEEITRKLKEIFYPEKPDWKLAVWGQAEKVARQALQGLDDWPSGLS
jgi:hypothetical protein